MINTPFTLPCGAVLSNRIAKAALTERLTRADFLPNELHNRLYDHWAQNGAGMMLSGNIIIDKRYLESTGNIVIEKETDITPFKEWTSIVTAHGNHFWAQLSHAGRQSNIFSTRNPVSASDVRLNKMGLFNKPIPLTEAGIEDVIERFVYAAGFCKQAGFTGVEFHAAHGYLISQFLSPKTNKRTDKWGGSIENRSRLLIEIIDRTRKVVGQGFPIAVKLNSADFLRGGFDEDDSLFVIKKLEEHGLDLLEISGGTYEKNVMFGDGLKESTLAREAYFLEFAEKVRSQCNLPFMVTGGFRTLAVCNKALKDNHLDIVGFGRPFMINESFPKGFLDGTKDKITYPKLKILDKNNADAAEASHYDLQIKRIANGLPLKESYSGLKLATHIGWIEMKKGISNWISG